MKSKEAPRGPVGLRAKALKAEGFSCTDCVFAKTGWRKSARDRERSCEERGYSVLCDLFRNRRQVVTCKDCLLFGTTDCTVATKRVKVKGTDAPCQDFETQDNDLEFSDRIKHDGKVTESLLYVGTPVTPVLIRHGQFAILVEPRVEVDNMGKETTVFSIIPTHLDAAGELITSDFGDSTTVYPCGQTHAVRPKKVTYKDRIRRFDSADSPVRKILVAAAAYDSFINLPDVVKYSYQEHLNSGASVELAARLAVTSFQEEHGIAQEQADMWREDLITYGNSQVGVDDA